MKEKIWKYHSKRIFLQRETSARRLLHAIAMLLVREVAAKFAATGVAKTETLEIRAEETTMNPTAGNSTDLQILRIKDINEADAHQDGQTTTTRSSGVTRVAKRFNTIAAAQEKPRALEILHVIAKLRIREVAATSAAAPMIERMPP
ncbi:hypothetical protein B9Z55_022121 [Caenorhabditis nigoni]|uniref:Uncharacterized protein n=1 Tax=Caenorhabditis nigoni TaxID=1611254 RepID=A0A2G5TUY3_9PELO|nr:hypothetical protein B9Z55_022121 [Caenorhabditis nigoni]